MRIALAQFNPVIGDFDGNRRRIADLARQAAAQGAQLAVFPELALCGYPPMDLLLYPAFQKANQDTLAALAAELPPGLAVVVGYAAPHEGGAEKTLTNTAAVLLGGQVVFEQDKTLLPTYDVFDEHRYFVPAAASRVWSWQGRRIGLALCEDLWWEAAAAQGTPYGADPVQRLAEAGADLILSPSASPFHAGKKRIRADILEAVGRKYGLPVVYVNQVGGNDSLIFDGASLVSNAQGQLVHQSPGFIEDLALVDLEALPPPRPLAEDPWEDRRQALVLGLRDYARKCGFTQAHLGLSGGVDSALVAALAVEAFGADKVRGFGLPSRYSSEGSVEDARALARNLGIRFDVLPIEEPFSAYLKVLEPSFEGRAPDLTEENIQARIRGTYLMAWSNKFNSLLLTTGNKSELAVGYCTLYGDMAGGLAVIGDLFKTEVYELCRHLNRGRELIPEATLTKAPSAELRPDQKDEDSLPPYPLLDAILRLYILEHRSQEEILARGYDPAAVQKALALTAKAEYKRWQAPPVLKISPLAFGTGRRLPLARRYFELGPR